MKVSFINSDNKLQQLMAVVGVPADLFTAEFIDESHALNEIEQKDVLLILDICRLNSKISPTSYNKISPTHI